MARASGSSHALAALVGLVAGELLVTYARPSFPRAISALEWAAREAARGIHGATGVGIPARTFVPLAVSCAIAFVWGVAFHLARYGARSD